MSSVFTRLCMVMSTASWSPLVALAVAPGAGPCRAALMACSKSATAPRRRAGRQSTPLPALLPCGAPRGLPPCLRSSGRLVHGPLRLLPGSPRLFCVATSVARVASAGLPQAVSRSRAPGLRLPLVGRLGSRGRVSVPHLGPGVLLSALLLLQRGSPCSTQSSAPRGTPGPCHGGELSLREWPPSSWSSALPLSCPFWAGSALFRRRAAWCPPALTLAASSRRGPLEGVGCSPCGP